MAFSFVHRPPPRKKVRSSWYENALLLAVAGSIIAVIGQLAGTIIPIMYGPADISDFDIILEDTIVQASSKTEPFVQEISKKTALTSCLLIEIKTYDLHPWIRPSRGEISFRALDLPKSLEIRFHPPRVPIGCKSQIELEFLNGIIPSPGYYPVTIQGIRGDGKAKNVTLYLQMT